MLRGPRRARGTTRRAAIHHHLSGASVRPGTSPARPAAPDTSSRATRCSRKAEPDVGLVGPRRRCTQGDVDDDEPQWLGRQADRGYHLVELGQPDQEQQRTDHDQHGEQHARRHGEPDQPCPHEVPPALVLARPGRAAGEAPDDEEQRHHLEHVRGNPAAGEEDQRRGLLPFAVGQVDRGHQPVPDDDGEHRGDPCRVDRAVTSVLLHRRHRAASLHGPCRRPGRHAVASLESCIRPASRRTNDPVTRCPQHPTRTWRQRRTPAVTRPHHRAGPARSRTRRRPGLRGRARPASPSPGRRGS